MYSNIHTKGQSDSPESLVTFLKIQFFFLSTFHIATLSGPAAQGTRAEKASGHKRGGNNVTLSLWQSRWRLESVIPKKRRSGERPCLPRGSEDEGIILILSIWVQMQKVATVKPLLKSCPPLLPNTPRQSIPCNVEKSIWVSSIQFKKLCQSIKNKDTESLITRWLRSSTLIPSFKYTMELEARLLRRSLLQSTSHHGLTWQCIWASEHLLCKTRHLEWCFWCPQQSEQCLRQVKSLKSDLENCIWFRLH